MLLPTRGCVPAVIRRSDEWAKRLRFALCSPEPRAKKFVAEQRKLDKVWVEDTEEMLRIEEPAPKVEVKDPNEAHKKMALALDDPENKNLHDVTAFLATLK